MKVTSTYWPFEGDRAKPCVFGPSFMKPEALDQIRDIGLSKELEGGKVNDGKENDTIRDCRSCIIWPHEMREIYHYLASIVKSLNDTNYGFDVSGFGEGLQFIEYTTDHGKYEYHIDQIEGGIVRKLTFVLQLSDGDEYDGGDLQLQLGHAEPFTFPRAKGAFALFPSFYLHRVTPVTRGIRHSLVGWVTGPPFK